MSIDRTGAAAGDSDPARHRSDYQSADSSESVEAQLARTRRELEMLRAKHREIMDLLGTEKPEKLVHDLRNVLNELHLLRLLSNTGNC